MIADVAMRDPDSLAATIVRYAITRIMMTPTLLNACLASPPGRCALRRLRQVILCGETVTDVIAARARQALIQAYIDVGDYPAAIEIVSKFVEQNPDIARARTRLESLRNEYDQQRQ